MKRVAIAFFLLSAQNAGAVEFHVKGEPLRLDITETLFLNYHGDPGNGDPSTAYYGEMISKLNLQLAWRKWLFGLRLDSAAYVHTPSLGDTLAKPNCTSSDCIGTVRPHDLKDRFRQTPYDPKKFFEKIFVSYNSRSIEATVGDFYVNFGKGMVLSIRKVDELAVDTTVLGGKFAFRRGNFSGVAMAGFTNIQNVDESSATYVADPYDFIAGAHADTRIREKVTVGAHIVGGLPSRNQSDTGPYDYYLRSGVTVDAPRATRWLGLYAEYARADDRILELHRAGDALYASATAFSSRATWLFEFKYYRNYQPWHSSNDPFGSLVYMTPPTLERVQTQISNNTDIVAGRLRVDWNVRPWLTLFVSPEVARLEPLQGETDSLFDVYTGAKFTWTKGRSHFFPLVGFRQQHDDTHFRVEERLIAVEWTATQAFAKGWSIEKQALIWIRQKGDESEPGDNQWTEGSVNLAVKWAPRLIFSGGYEFTTEALQRANQHDFFNGAIQWNITSATSLRLFGGGQRSGLKCVSGVCRLFPAFQGARLELVVRL